MKHNKPTIKRKQPRNRKVTRRQTVERLRTINLEMSKVIEKLQRNRLGLVAEIQHRDKVIQRLDDFHEIWSVIRADYWLGKHPE